MVLGVLTVKVLNRTKPSSERKIFDLSFVYIMNGSISSVYHIQSDHRLNPKTSRGCRTLYTVHNEFHLYWVWFTWVFHSACSLTCGDPTDMWHWSKPDNLQLNFIKKNCKLSKSYNSLTTPCTEFVANKPNGTQMNKMGLPVTGSSIQPLMSQGRLAVSYLKYGV